MISVIMAYEIATNHPNGDILVTAGQDKKTKKWCSFMYMMRDGNIHKLMLSYNIGSNGFEGFDTEEIAMEKMNKIITLAKDYVNKKDESKTFNSQ